MACQYFTQYWHLTGGEGAMPARRIARSKPQRVKERDKTTEKSLFRGSAPSCTIDRPLPPCREPKSEGKGASRLDPRRARRRWTGLTVPQTVQNDGEESPPPFSTFFTTGSANPPVVGCDTAWWRTHHPGSSSPAETAMEAWNDFKNDAQLRGRVFPEVLHRF